MTTAVPAPAAIELIGIDKSFGAVHANKAVTLRVAAGSIHGIVGENGAGKSTLMSILYGFYEADRGEIQVGGAPVRIASSRDAIRHGIGMVHQHFMLVDTLSVLDNVMLGAEGGALVARGAAAIRLKLAEFGRAYGLTVDPDALVGTLGVGLQQRVEILKALVRGATILILDEPTAVLTPAEADQLFAMLDRLRRENKTVILITHKLREIMAVTDRVSVMRRGEMVLTTDTAATSPAQLADAMVGRRVLLTVAKGASTPGPVRLEARNITVLGHNGVPLVSDVSFTVRGGEIAGLAGVAGNGQSELLEALAGIRPLASGEILIDGCPVPSAAHNPKAIRALGLAHVPEDRHRMGLVMPFEAAESAVLGIHGDPAFGAGPWLSRRRIVADLARKMAGYDIRPADPRLKTANFSGGNQQKIVLAREMERDPGIVLAGQPTRGVDIGAIEFIHKRLVALRDAGKAVLVVSVELDEIMALSDVILVMCGGRLTGRRTPPPDAASDDTFVGELGLLMAGVTEQAA
ncbi:ABC transporter ATP-binding protein [Lichenihabitans sp. Uapishka_5]|uniref:ABC transporter ATP-binding protein n=1 Tax=Lichenihabitans sp. Uapishka_5 TaxID=3037302 RepID=UPI0029E7FE3F|nr:ABC transporter ATP-binding protein [Lichenihabitans sp. Uapishka_5]MDX7953098.1 ABC transporter ATP-binding protein [Lichenihabitans sp. Uapishka_5]